MERLHCKENWCRLAKDREDAREPAVGGAGVAGPEEKLPCVAEKRSPLRVPCHGTVS